METPGHEIHWSGYSSQFSWYCIGGTAWSNSAIHIIKQRWCFHCNWSNESPDCLCRWWIIYSSGFLSHLVRLLHDYAQTGYGCLAYLCHLFHGTCGDQIMMSRLIDARKTFVI